MEKARKVKLSIPGKTFLAGEYLALLGGPAFILNTDPRFELHVEEVASDLKGIAENPFQPESPAGKLFVRHQEKLQNLKMTFQDPYQGVGGFGASSAQFALLSAVLQLGEEVFGDSERFFDWHQILKEYRELGASGPKAIPPSGADIVGALGGGITYFDRNAGHMQTFAWPFQNYGFALFHTGEKLATHEHLKNLKLFETRTFQDAAIQILQGLAKVEFETFIGGVQTYRNELFQQGWVTVKSKACVEKFETLDFVSAAKACGAMGSDVVLVIYQSDATQNLNQLKEVGLSLGLSFMACTSDISKGISVHPQVLVQKNSNEKFASTEASL